MKDVAAALSIPPPRVTDIIKGMREVQVDEVEALAILLGLSLQSLLNSLKAGKLRDAGNDNTAPLLPVLGRLTGSGMVEPATPRDTKGVPLPPDADTADGLFCYIMGDDSMSRDIREGSLVIAGDPKIHGTLLVPGAIFIIDLGNGRLVARSYVIAGGEHWLMPMAETPNPQHAQFRFSMLPKDMDNHRMAANDDADASLHRTIRPDDVKATVMWVHRRHAVTAELS